MPIQICMSTGEPDPDRISFSFLMYTVDLKDKLETASGRWEHGRGLVRWRCRFGREATTKASFATGVDGSRSASGKGG